MSKRILFVEDDKDFSEAVKIILETEGFTVVHCFSIEQVPSLTNQESFDVVILDYHLPDGEGTDVVEKLRAHESTKKIPVILMSADSSIQGKAKESGVRWFMPKPVDFDLLLKRIKSL